MKVGKYQIGRFHAIIRKEYADGSVDYETSFTDIEDFNESYYCILKCIVKEVGIATDNPKVLTYACVIRGKEEIEKVFKEAEKAETVGVAFSKDAGNVLPLFAHASGYGRVSLCYEAEKIVTVGDAVEQIKNATN